MLLIDETSIAIVSTEPINVKAFGAKGNGVDDDGEALQLAFGYAKANKVEVYIPSGTYKFSGQLTIDSISVGGNRTSSILVPTSATGGEVQLTGTNTVLKDLSFEGNRGPRTNGHAIKTVVDANNQEAVGLNIKNLNVNNYPGRGIELNNLTSGSVENCRITNCKDQAIMINYSYNMTVAHCEFRNNHDGVEIWGGNANPAIYAAHQIGAGDITITNCVVNNDFNSNHQTGVFAALTDGLTVTNCVIKNCSDVGLDIEACQNSTISDNVVKNCINGCLTTFYGGDNVVFADNACVQGDGYGPGIFIHAGGDLWLYRSSFVNNQIKTYNKSGFYAHDLTLDTVKIQDNTIVQTVNNNNSGIRIADSKAVSIVNNYVEVCQTKGISYEGISNGEIKNNKIICKNNPNGDVVGLFGIHLYWRSGTYPCQNNDIGFNRIEGFTKSTYDQPWGDVISNNWFYNNRCSSLHKSTNSASYQGRYDNNVSLTNPNTAITVIVS